MERCLFRELALNEKYLVQLKMATRKYEVSNSNVKVHIDLGTEKEVVISEKDRNEYCDISCWLDEPIYNNLKRQLLNAKDGRFIKTLKHYKKNGGTQGRKIDDKLFIKLYHANKPDIVERAIYGRKWIDYNEQISKSICISDVENGCGIWVTTIDYLYKVIGVACRYGENIMVLSPIHKLEYIDADKEIVGDKFEVKMHGSLNDEHTWNELGKLLGDIVFEKMPLYVRESYVGADKAYEEYKIRQSNLWSRNCEAKDGLENN